MTQTPMTPEFELRVGIKHRLSVLTDNKTGLEYLIFYHHDEGFCVLPRYGKNGKN